MVKSAVDLLEPCLHYEVEKVVASSSTPIYDVAQEFPTTERQNSYHNRTLYGAANAFNEGLLRTFNDVRAGLHCPQILQRLWESQGRPWSLRRGAHPLDEAPAGRSVANHTGQRTMEFVHVRDMARANILGAKSEVIDEAFNIASGRETSLAQFARALPMAMDRTGLDPEFAAQRSVNPVPRRLASMGKAVRLPGFQAEIPLNWWRAQRHLLVVPREPEVIAP
jgi:UDP-glucose 4-epimerase